MKEGGGGRGHWGGEKGREQEEKGGEGAKATSEPAAPLASGSPVLSLQDLGPEGSCAASLPPVGCALHYLHLQVTWILVMRLVNFMFGLNICDLSKFSCEPLTPVGWHQEVGPLGGAGVP